MANLTITKVTDGYFDFNDDANNTYGGNTISYWYDAVNIYFKVDERVYTYTFEEVSYDDGVTTIGFASTIEVITALKTAGFTGNFNSGGATPQVKQAIYYVEGQDNTGFLNVVERKNTIGFSFEFVRTGVGTFTCPGFDIESHSMSFFVRNASTTEIGNFFQDAVNNDFITTIKTPLVNAGFEVESDLTFSFGGTIIITEILQQ